MKNYPKVSFDCDGVLSDFIKAMCEKYDRKLENFIGWGHKWIFDKFEDIKNDQEFWKSFDTILNPDDIRFYVHCYITAIPESMKEARKSWLIEKGFQNRDVIVSNEKDKTVNELGINVHIDDKLQTILDIQENCPNCTPILFLPWYLRYEHIPEDVLVARNAKELNEIMLNISKKFLRNMSNMSNLS